MSSSEWAAAALQSFDAVVQATEGFRSRAGQRRMAEEVARVFSVATLGKGPGTESGAAHQLQMRKLMPPPPVRSP